MVLKKSAQRIYADILKLKSYKPSAKVNGLFSNLVSLALSDSTKKLFSASQTKQLQQISSQAEYQLELYWSQKIIASPDPLKILQLFPYYKNYEELTKMEWLGLLSCTKHPHHRILFIGGGPLPLTALILTRQYGQKITILEKDPEAWQLAVNLVDRLGLNKQIAIKLIDGLTFNNYHNYNLIWVAALAGITGTIKKQLLAKIKKDAPADVHILARSTWGSRKLLYRPIDQQTLKLFQPLLELRPHNNVVNSAIIMIKNL